MTQPSSSRLVTESANATVSAADRARANHTGTQSADTVVDGTTNKAYTAAEKTKLAGVATAATANRADAATDAAIGAAVAAVTPASIGLGNVSNTSDASKPLSTAATTALAAKADLVGGLVPTSQMPSLSLVTAVPVANQAAMLALTTTQVQPGDLAVRADGAGTFILLSADPTQLANWLRLNAPTDVVTTVNGQQGTVVLAKADVGLGNVDNTADSAKPVSTAQAAADIAATAAAQGTSLQKSSNLSDLASASAARTALGLGTAATQPSSAFDAAGAAAAAAAPSAFYRGGASDLSRGYVSKPLFVSAYQSVPTANSTTGAIFTFRATHTLTQAVAGFRLVMPLGFNISSGQTAADVIWSGSTPVKVSVEIAGAIRPVTWWGSRVKTADPGGVLVSDLIAADLPAGTQVPVRVNVPTSTLYPNTVGTGQGPGATATGDGYTNGADTSDAMTAVGVAITAGYFCHGLVSTPVSAPKPTVAFLGDSITAGTGDATNNGGWTAYLSNGTVPNLRLAVAGAAAQGWVGAHTYSWPYLDYCTHALVLLGANDLTTGNGPRTYAQFTADLTSIYTAMKNRGLKVYGCTLLPRTTSTDAWATTTNQTAASTAFTAGGASVRGQINAWIRAGGGGLLSGYFETADPVESARDSGLWKANYTTDGAHPTQVAHQAIATALASQFAALTV